MFRLFASIVLALLLAPTTSVAQLTRELVQGQRIRVQSRCDILKAHVLRCPDAGYLWTYDGQLGAFEGDSLRIRPKSGQPEYAIPARSITSISVLDGTRGHLWEGAGLGLIGGAILGLGIGSMMEFCVFSCGPATELGAMVGAPAGFLLGGIIGTLIRSDRWRLVSVDAQRIRVAPRLDTPGFTVSLTF